MRKLTQWMLVMLIAGGWMLPWAARQASGGVSVSVGGSVGLAVDSDEGLIIRDEGKAPGANYVRVDLSLLGGDVAAPSFWRVKFRDGFTWVDGRWENDLYIPGYWHPQKSRGADWAWVPGHWVGRTWIKGRWRPSQRVGYAWIEGHWDRYGEWVEGYWRPLAPPAREMVWEPGYWGPRGEWVDGYWRPAARRGFFWVPGEYNQQGLWIRGRWQSGGPDHVWIKGYWDHQGRWYPGKVAKIPNRGQKYFPGHYDRRGAWVAPRWIDEQAWQREMDRQTDNYRRDREGRADEENRIPYGQQEKNYRQDREGPPDTHSEGGQVRPIGGKQGYRSAPPNQPRHYEERPPAYREENRDGGRGRDDYPTAPRQRREERPAYDKPGHDRPADPRGADEVRIPERERTYPRNDPQPQNQPQAQPQEKSNPGLHKGWDKQAGDRGNGKTPDGNNPQPNDRGQGNSQVGQPQGGGQSGQDQGNQKNNYRKLR